MIRYFSGGLTNLGKNNLIPGWALSGSIGPDYKVSQSGVWKTPLLFELTKWILSGSS